MNTGKLSIITSENDSLFPDNIQGSREYDTDLFLRNITDNTNSHNLTYFKLDNTYAILNRELKSSKHHTVSTINKFELKCNGIIDFIELVDFPISQYILNINGNNVMTAKCSNNNHVFDLGVDNPENNSGTGLSFFKYHSVVNDEPNIENRQKYLNCNRIDYIKICFPKHMKFEFNSKYEIKVRGFFKENNQWITTTKSLYVFPNSDNNMELDLNQPTDSIDFEISVVNNKIGTLILQINGDEYKRITIDENNKNFPFHRIKCQDPDRKYIGKQNSYLSDEINLNTINFSRVDRINCIMINCKITNIWHHYYGFYDFPTRKRFYC